MNYNVQVENLVAIELAYINTKHPDFAEAYTVHRSVSDHAAGDTHRSLSSSSLARNMVDKQAEEVKVGQLGDEKNDLIFLGEDMMITGLSARTAFFLIFFFLNIAW